MLGGRLACKTNETTCLLYEDVYHQMAAKCGLQDFASAGGPINKSNDFKNYRYIIYFYEFFIEFIMILKIIK